MWTTSYKVRSCRSGFLSLWQWKGLRSCSVCRHCRIRTDLFWSVLISSSTSFYSHTSLLISDLGPAMQRLKKKKTPPPFLHPPVCPHIALTSVLLPSLTTPLPRVLSTPFTSLISFLSASFFEQSPFYFWVFPSENSLLTFPPPPPPPRNSFIATYNTARLHKCPQSLTTKLSSGDTCGGGLCLMRVCVCARVGVWGMFVFLFQHMIYCPCLLGCLCASECEPLCRRLHCNVLTKEIWSVMWFWD